MAGLKTSAARLLPGTPAAMASRAAPRSLVVAGCRRPTVPVRSPKPLALLRGVRAEHRQQLPTFVLRASSQDHQDSDTKAPSEATKEEEAAPKAMEEAPLKPKKPVNTLSSLNMILGIDEEAEKAAKEAQDAKELGLDRPPKTAPAKAVSSAAADIVAGSTEESTDAPPKLPGRDNDLEADVSDQMARLSEQARKIREEEKAGKTNTEDEVELRKEFQSLLTMLKPDGGVSKEDIKVLKEQVFGPMTFWVTETKLTEERDGYLIRGNMRCTQEELFPEVIKKVQELYDGRYEIMIIEDPEAEEPVTEGQPARIAFKLVPASAAYPPPAGAWQVLAALVLLALSFGSSVQLGLVAEISKLPAETLQWLLNPENLNKVDAVPPGLDDFDAVEYVASALPIALYVLSIQGMHELGYRIVAFVNGTKLGPPFLIPNGQLGTFGSVTQIKSMLRNRTELLDVAVSGPVVGGAASLALFGYGLALSSSGQPDVAGELIPIPELLLQSSLGLGSITSAALGEAANKSQILVHPCMLAGWVGLYTTALNLLPVGSLDGGRMVQAAFGRNALAGTSFLCYIGLGLGLLGGNLALAFGLYVLLLRRAAEQYIQDSVTEVSDSKKSLVYALVLLAFFITLPNIPDQETLDTLTTSSQNFI